VLEPKLNLEIEKRLNWLDVRDGLLGLWLVDYT